MRKHFYFAGVFCLSVAFLTVSGAHGQLASSPWPMFHRDVQHTGLSTSAGPSLPLLSWSYKAGLVPSTSDEASVQSAPAIGSDWRVYYGAGDHRFYSLNSDGTFVWSYQSGDYADYCPALGNDGSVYIASKDNNLYTLDSSGALLWSYATGEMHVNFAHSSPTLSTDGKIYLGSNDNNLYTFSSGGALLWSYAREGGGLPHPRLTAMGPCILAQKIITFTRSTQTRCSNGAI